MDALDAELYAEWEGMVDVPLTQLPIPWFNMIAPLHIWYSCERTFPNVLPGGAGLEGLDLIRGQLTWPDPTGFFLVGLRKRTYVTQCDTAAQMEERVRETFT